MMTDQEAAAFLDEEERKHQRRLERAPAQIQRGLEKWGKWVIECIGREDDPMTMGTYSGWCPLHDAKHKKTSPPSAKFDLRGGHFWCLADPRCTGNKRAISLINLQTRIDAAKASGSAR